MSSYIIVHCADSSLTHHESTVTLFPRIIRIRVHRNVHILRRMFSSAPTAEKQLKLFLPLVKLLGFKALGRQCPGHEMWPPDIFTSLTSDMWQMPPRPDIFMWKLDSVWNVTPDLIFSHPENQCQHQHNVPPVPLCSGLDSGHINIWAWKKIISRESNKKPS